MFTYILSDKKAMQAFASRLACFLKMGDNLLISGDSHVGKTFFIHHLISYLYRPHVPPIHMPDPKTHFVHHYQLPQLSVAHYDMYRVEGIGDNELTRFSDDKSDIKIIEWPEALTDRYDEQCFYINIIAQGGEKRLVSMEARSSCTIRSRRFYHFSNFLETHNIHHALCENVAGDATDRKYYRITIPKNDAKTNMELHQKNFIVMSDETFLYNDYGMDNTLSPLDLSQTTMKPFCSIAQILAEFHINIPCIYAVDMHNMFLLLEDFGSHRLGEDFFSIPGFDEAYETAIDMLIHLALQPDCHLIDTRLVYSDSKMTSTYTYIHQIKRYTCEDYYKNLTTVLDWYYPEISQEEANEDMRISFRNVWQYHINEIVRDKAVLTLRDFHSPNIFWLPENEGMKRIGVIDFQDAAYCHIGYDLASLLMDARCDLSQEYHDKWLYHYIDKISLQIQGFNAERFLVNYWRIGAKRNSRILGVFIRLLRRDGKPEYVKHLPRVWRYLMYCLSHPELSDLKEWYDTYLTHHSLSYIENVENGI